MRRMAATAALGLHGYVLIDEWTLFVSMALETGCVSSRKSSCLADRSGSVHVVTVGTLHETFVHPVPEWSGEFGACRGVAVVAKLWLSFQLQILRFFRVVSGMTIETSEIVTVMRRRPEMSLLLPLAVTTEATGICPFAREFRKSSDLADLASARYMLCTWTMARFASMSTF